VRARLSSTWAPPFLPLRLPLEVSATAAARPMPPGPYGGAHAIVRTQ
jgi:hypothetical protein